MLPVNVPALSVQVPALPVRPSVLPVQMSARVQHAPCSSIKALLPLPLALARPVIPSPFGAATASSTLADMALKVARLNDKHGNENNTDDENDVSVTSIIDVENDSDTMSDVAGNNHNNSNTSNSSKDAVRDVHQINSHHHHRHNFSGGVDVTNNINSCVPPLLPISSIIMSGSSDHVSTTLASRANDTIGNDTSTGLNDNIKAVILQSLVSAQSFQHFNQIQQQQQQEQSSALSKVSTAMSVESDESGSCVDQGSDIGSEDNPLCIDADDQEEQLYPTPISDDEDHFFSSATTAASNQSINGSAQYSKAEINDVFSPSKVTNLTSTTIPDEQGPAGRVSSLSTSSTLSAYSISPITSPTNYKIVNKSYNKYPTLTSQLPSPSSSTNTSKETFVRHIESVPPPSTSSWQTNGSGGSVTVSSLINNSVSTCQMATDVSKNANSCSKLDVSSNNTSPQPGSERGSTEDERENRENELREYEKKVFNYEQAKLYLTADSSSLELPLTLPLVEGGRNARQLRVVVGGEDGGKGEQTITTTVQIHSEQVRPVIIQLVIFPF